MSFLAELQSKKNRLNPTITCITYTDGSQEQVNVNSEENSDQNPHRNRIKSKTYGFVVDTKPDHTPACILKDFLYLGSQDSVTLANVHDYQLTDVLSVGIETPESDINSAENSATVRCYFVPCLDLPETKLQPIINQTNAIIKHVRNENGRILVHCNAGVSRSSTVCIAFLIQEMKMSFDEAFNLVKSERECIQTNCGFLRQLKLLNNTKKK